MTAGAIEPVVCPMLLDEFEDTLRTDRILATLIPATDVDAYVRILALGSQVRPDPVEIRAR